MDRFYCNPDNTDPYYSQVRQEDGQHASLPEAGQTSAGVPVSGSHTLPGQLSPNTNFPAQIPPSPSPVLEYFLSLPQPVSLEEIIQNDASAANQQPVVEARRRWLPVKERFLAGLEAFGRRASLKDCSSSLRFSDYIKNDGSLSRKGLPLYETFTTAEKARLDQAIAARRATQNRKRVPEDRVKEDCSVTLEVNTQVSDTGHSENARRELCAGLIPGDQERVNQALLSRSQICGERWLAAKAPVAERFLAGLDNYAQGVKLKDCSATLSFKYYVSDDGFLSKKGRALRNRLSPPDQARLNQALLSRNYFHLKQVMVNAPVEERFLASLDNYARGVSLRECARNIGLPFYITGGSLNSRGRALYNRLSTDDKARVNQALTTRKEVIAQRTSGDLDKFMATLEPYGNGLSLLECGNQSGLMERVITYLTPEGGLTPKGELLIENLQPDQQIDVLFAIGKRQQFMDPSAQVPGSPWQLPEMPLSMPGPSESTEPPIPYYDREAVGADFQHQYGPNGVIPQRAPDQLIDRGIVHYMLINILGEVYRVYDMRNLVDPSNRDSYEKNFMLIPRMRGG
ncbi:MAG: hypothetical protein P8X89_01780 [Reinekea sp.]